MMAEQTGDLSALGLGLPVGQGGVHCSFRVHSHKELGLLPYCVRVSAKF